MSDPISSMGVRARSTRACLDEFLLVLGWSYPNTAATASVHPAGCDPMAARWSEPIASVSSRSPSSPSWRGHRDRIDRQAHAIDVMVRAGRRNQRWAAAGGTLAHHCQ